MKNFSLIYTYTLCYVMIADRRDFLCFAYNVNVHMQNFSDIYLY